MSNPGGLFDSAIQMYKQVDPNLKIRNRDLEIVFSSGATLKFAYLDSPSDKYNFQGAELTFIGLTLRRVPLSSNAYRINCLNGESL